MKEIKYADTVKTSNASLILILSGRWSAQNRDTIGVEY